MSGESGDRVPTARLDPNGALLMEHLMVDDTAAILVTVCGLIIPADAKDPPKSAGRCKVCLDVNMNEHPARRLR